MSVVSVVGPKGGIGKTTLSINTTAALTRIQKYQAPEEKVCLVDLDLRLPTITSMVDSHPRKTFFDLFETLAGKTYQADFVRSIYQILTTFDGYIKGYVAENDPSLVKHLGMFHNLKPDLFHHSDFSFGDQVHELFLHREETQSVQDIKALEPVINKTNLHKMRAMIRESDLNSRPIVEEYVNYIEEFGFSIIGGEVPVLGKKGHRRRINEPEYLLLFLEFLEGVLNKFDNVILDTPAGGVNHLSSLMNLIDQVIFVFDLSNNIAVNGSIDALHSFIDYYEDFHADYLNDRLSGLDKAYVNRLIAKNGEDGLKDSLKNKKLGILFNRCQGMKEVPKALNKIREYLDTLDQYDNYKDRIHITGMVPNHKVINITNNRGVLFYKKDIDLTGQIDLVAKNILTENKYCPTLGSEDKEIVAFLEKYSKPSFASKITRIASSFT